MTTGAVVLTGTAGTDGSWRSQSPEYLPPAVISIAGLKVTEEGCCATEWPQSESNVMRVSARIWAKNNAAPGTHSRRWHECLGNAWKFSLKAIRDFGVTRSHPNREPQGRQYATCEPTRAITLREYEARLRDPRHAPSRSETLARRKVSARLMNSGATAKPLSQRVASQSIRPIANVRLLEN